MEDSWFTAIRKTVFRILFTGLIIGLVVTGVNAFFNLFR